MIDDSTESEARYRCLWLAVILRAKQDAEGMNLMCDMNPNERPKLIRDAKNWLCIPSKELTWVAWAAGVEETELMRVGRGIKDGSRGALAGHAQGGTDELRDE